MARYLSDKYQIEVGKLAYLIAAPPELTPEVLVQCEACHTVAPLPTGRKGNSYVCVNSRCRHQNFLEGMWESLVKKAESQIARSAKLRKPSWRRPESPKVFISFASEQEDLANEIARLLEARRAAVWLYSDKIVPGDRLVEQLGRGLNSANCGVFLISREFLKKGWPRAELDVLLHKFIESRSVRVIPVLINVDHEELAQIIPMMRGIVSISFSTLHETARRIASAVFKPAEPSDTVISG